MLRPLLTLLLLTLLPMLLALLTMLLPMLPMMTLLLLPMLLPMLLHLLPLLPPMLLPLLLLDSLLWGRQAMFSQPELQARGVDPLHLSSFQSQLPQNG
jgi:hypothetical protein